LFGYRSGSIKISPKAWSKLEQAERDLGVISEGDLSASSSASSAPLRFDLSNNDPLEIRELSGVLERIAIALEKLVEFEEKKHI
jgi:hypothetical protein